VSGVSPLELGNQAELMLHTACSSNECFFSLDLIPRLTVSALESDLIMSSSSKECSSDDVPTNGSENRSRSLGPWWRFQCFCLLCMVTVPSAASPGSCVKDTEEGATGVAEASLPLDVEGCMVVWISTYLSHIYTAHLARCSRWITYNTV
jgi:hypothetical protein